MKRLRTAIIGCGGIARTHAKVLAELEQVTLVGFCDVAPERAAAFNETYAGGRAQVFEDYHALFETLDLDLVYICLPPYAHSDEVALACRHGVHTLA